MNLKFYEFIATTPIVPFMAVIIYFQDSSTTTIFNEVKGMGISKYFKNTSGGKNYRHVYLPFVWHGFFLALTMSMIDMNTVLPALISQLTTNTVAFGALYSILLGAPLIFNLLFSAFLQRFPYKKKFLLLGMYLRSLSFLGMAVITLLFAKGNPLLTLAGFYILIFLFSISGGFASIAYSDIVGKLLPPEKRGILYSLRQFFSGIAALLGGFFVVWVFKAGNLVFPLNYSIGFFIGTLGLIIGSLGFFKLKETPSEISAITEGSTEGFTKGISKILLEDKRFLRFIILENITSFSLMILPFYMVFIKNNFTNYMNYIGIFVIAQVTGSIASNFLWAFISSKFGSSSVIKLCVFIGAIIPIIAMVIKPFGILSYIIVFLLVGFITSGRNVGFESYLLDIAPNDKRTMYLGIRGTLNIMVVLLPLAGGLIINLLGYYITFMLVSLIMFLGFFSIINN